MKNLKYYLTRASQEGWAMGQFNFSVKEVLEAVVKAAQALNAPLIVGISEKQSRVLGLEEALELFGNFKKDLPIFLNLDHAEDLSYIKKAILLGYDGVHFDGSNLSLEDNMEKTKEIADFAKKSGAVVEGELGFIGTMIDKKEVLTDPSGAQQFLEDTKADSLAVAIGNLHGGNSSGQNPNLNLKRLAEIKEKTGSIPLVLHGGSGAKDKDVKEAVKLGIAQVNISTELKLAYAKALENNLDGDSMVKFIQKTVEEKIKLFGSENKI